MPKALFSFFLILLMSVGNSANAQFVREPDKRPSGFRNYYNLWPGIEPKDRLDPDVNVSRKSISELKILLMQMYDADQQYRDSLHNGSQTPEKKKYYWIKIIETDWVNQWILDKIIAKYGWPTIDQFGEQGAEIAWFIIWHADRPFAVKHLDKIEKVFKEGRIREEQYLSMREKWGF